MNSVRTVSTELPMAVSIDTARHNARLLACLDPVRIASLRLAAKAKALGKGNGKGKGKDDKSSDRVAAEVAGSKEAAAVGAVLWSNRSFTDCEVSLEESDAVWRVHRCVLAGRSPVLRRMLESGMVEDLSGKIVFRGASRADVEAFLYYLYNAKLPDTNFNPGDIVEYYSSKGMAWVKAAVVQLNADGTVELDRKRKANANQIRLHKQNSVAGSADVPSRWSATGVMEMADMYEVSGLLKVVVDEAEETVHNDNLIEVMRAMNKRKSNPIVESAFKRLKQRVRDDAGLYEQLADSV